LQPIVAGPSTQARLTIRAGELQLRKPTQSEVKRNSLCVSMHEGLGKMKGSIVYSYDFIASQNKKCPVEHSLPTWFAQCRLF